MQSTGHTSTQSEQYMQRESSITNPTAKGLALPEPSASRLVCSMEMQWSGQILMHCRHAMQRSMSTVSIPRLLSGRSRLYSGYWRVIFCPKRCWRVTPIPFKMPCPNCGISETFLGAKRGEQEHQPRRHEQPDQRHRNQNLPAEVHELVHPQARHAPPDPLESKHDERRLYPEPDPVEGPEVQERQRRLPAAQKQRHGDRRDNRHRGELRGLYEGPGHPRVLDHEPADDLALAFWQVERHPFDLSYTRDVEGDEHRELRQEVPGPDRIPLRPYDGDQREAPREHHDAEEAKDQWHLIRDHLRSPAQSAEQRERRTAPVAGHDDAESSDGRDRD